MGTEPEDYQMSGLGLSAGLKGITRKVVEKANEKLGLKAPLPLHARVVNSILSLSGW